MTDTTEGGADWELGEASRKLGAALGVNGVAAESLRVAMADHAAAVGSKSTQMISALFLPIMQTQQDTRTDIAGIAHQQAVSDRALDTLVTTMQHIAAMVVQIAEAQKKSDARLAKLEEGQHDLAARMSASEAERAGIRDRLDRLELVNERLDRIEAVINDRPTRRTAEYRAIAEAAADEAIKRLEARDGG